MKSSTPYTKVILKSALGVIFLLLLIRLLPIIFRFVEVMAISLANFWFGIFILLILIWAIWFFFYPRYKKLREKSSRDDKND